MSRVQTVAISPLYLWLVGVEPKKAGYLIEQRIGRICRGVPHALVKNPSYMKKTSVFPAPVNESVSVSKMELKA